MSISTGLSTPSNPKSNESIEKTHCYLAVQNIPYVLNLHQLFQKVFLSTSFFTIIAHNDGTNWIIYKKISRIAYKICHITPSTPLGK